MHRSPYQSLSGLYSNEKRRMDNPNYIRILSLNGFHWFSDANKFYISLLNPFSFCISFSACDRESLSSIYPLIPAYKDCIVLTFELRLRSRIFRSYSKKPQQRVFFWLFCSHTLFILAMALSFLFRFLWHLHDSFNAL